MSADKSCQKPSDEDASLLRQKYTLRWSAYEFEMRKYVKFLAPIVVGLSIILFPVRMWFVEFGASSHLLLRFFDLILIVIGTAIATIGICGSYYSSHKKQENP